jgi:hypothetical protein
VLQGACEGPQDIFVLLVDQAGEKSGGSWLVTLGVRSRHLCVTWIVSTQKLNLIGTVLRANTRTLLVWRLRSQKETDLLCEELSGYYPKETIMDIFEYATCEPYSVKLDAKDKKDIFWLRFERRLVPESGDTSNELGDGSGPVVPSAPEPMEEQRPGPSQVRGKGGPGPAPGKGAKAP